MNNPLLGTPNPDSAPALEVPFAIDLLFTRRQYQRASQGHAGKMRRRMNETIPHEIGLLLLIVKKTRNTAQTLFQFSSTRPRTISCTWAPGGSRGRGGECGNVEGDFIDLRGRERERGIK